MKEENDMASQKQEQNGERWALRRSIGHSDHRLDQVWRDETHAVYKHFGNRDQFIGWEAIKIKKLPAKKLFDSVVPAREGYPSDSKNSRDFGTIAFSVGAQHDLDYAIERAKRIP